ncbi:hypothetical protein LSAT2_022261 [Lamellibrachia satsuma]|nr:hypothetical protein LSAT2_022261 [Lamellibrachia satsuma]
MDNLSDLLQQDSVSESSHQVATGGSVIERLLQQKQGLQEHVISRTEPENVHLIPDPQQKGSDGRKITVKMMGWNQYTVNRPILLGIHQMELRLLNKLGYEVLVINPKEAAEFGHKTHEERRSFVQEKIFKKLDIHL